MASCRFTIAGCAVAAKALGYDRVGDLIVAQGMGPHAVVRLFRSSASKTWKRDAALIVLSGSVARYKAAPVSWGPEPTATLARDLIGDDLGAISDTATRLVREHWPAIQDLVGGEAAA